jgi:signal transduction histidine kinase
MLPKSIRWRLPLSYAAIALLAALALGAVLLLTLRDYYARRERDYLAGNAQAISYAIGPLVEADLPPEVLQEQLDNFSFLSQTRVRLLDMDGQLIAESSTPEAFNVALTTASLSGDDVTSGYRGFITVRGDFTGPAMIQFTSPLAPSTGGGQAELEAIYFQAMPVVGTPYGFGLNVESVSDERRSDQVVRWPLYDSAGKQLGSVELSHGPAYGLEVVSNVARGWAIAGAIAVLLAAGAGWLVSRSISAPLLALTHVTTQMAGGDLTARAAIVRQDEFGLLARSFNRMADQVEDTVSTLRRFVSDAAHEIHTPLTALHTNLELAPDDEFVEQARVQVERLERLSGELLDLSRIEASAEAQPRAPVALAALVREASELHASRAEQAGLTFHLALPEISPTVRGDAAQLRRALDNLLDNAVKFTPAGGKVSVGLREEGERVTLWVEDTGIGIPAEDLSLLFSRFHRGRNATQYPGSGLGLAIVKAVAEAHGGQVRAENTEGGARFTLRLPLAA